jgi:hypothetical protein
MTDITARLMDVVSGALFGKPAPDQESIAALCYEAEFEISILRDALVAAVGPGKSDDPMVQKEIDTARTVATKEKDNAE